jgi:uroporphyrinogen decarboxylase
MGTIMVRDPAIGEKPAADRKLPAVLGGETVKPPPIWLMRQAGRYLPEYRAARTRAGSFLDLCFDPDLATEVTLQPIRRYGLDAAILFSDILVVPYALGQDVRFEEGRGPRLTPLESPADLDRLTAEDLETRLAPVYETLRLVRRALPDETALIGFAGAPWTLATYMLEGGSSSDFAAAKGCLYRDPAYFERLVDLLVDATARHLIAQVEAGAEVLQIFDSWAGILSDDLLRRWSLAPLKEIVARVKAVEPEVPVILFPRGAGLLYHDFACESGAEALSLDTTVPLDWARRELQPRVALQGNLDPQLLLAGGPALTQGCRRILETLGDGPFVFNLGHGVVPATPPEHVAQVVEFVRSWTS